MRGRDAGSGGRYTGRSSATRPLNVRIEYGHPIRSAITVAGITRKRLQQLADPRLIRIKDRPHRPPLIPRRAVAGQRRLHRIPRDPQQPRDLRDRHTLRHTQPPDLRPLLHAQHWVPPRLASSQGLSGKLVNFSCRALVSIQLPPTSDRVLRAGTCPSRTRHEASERNQRSVLQYRRRRCPRQGRHDAHWSWTKHNERPRAVDHDDTCVCGGRRSRRLARRTAYSVESPGRQDPHSRSPDHPTA